MKNRDFGIELLQGNPKIVSSRDGGSLRRILNGRHIKPVDYYPSWKAQMSLPCEADHEVGLLQHSDCDGAVKKCLTQPHRLEIPVNFQNKPLIYFPDLRRDLADGTVEIIETKREDDKRLRDPHYQLKLDAAGIIYERLGWKFRTLMRDQILSGRLYDNVREISGAAYVMVSLAMQFELDGEIRKAGGAMPLGRATEIVGCLPRIHALIVRRMLHMRLDQLINEDSPVSLLDHDALRRSSPPML